MPLNGMSRQRPPELGCLSGLDAMEIGDPGQRVGRAKELRRQAALARQAASVPTSGSGRVDRLLVVLADQLERDASILEQGSNGD
jgi:hypothetical protein